MPLPKLLIIGGGIVGTTFARAAATSKSFDSITLVEKEASLGYHASSRNSGVIHAGFYYEPDSFKAKFCAAGSALMRQFCEENQLPLNKCGKVVVSKSPKEDSVLEKLYSRGKQNGCDIQLLPRDQLSQYEPSALTCSKFLWSPNTWSASPIDVMGILHKNLLHHLVDIKLNSKLVSVSDDCAILTDGSKISFDIAVNVAGGHALAVSKLFGLVTNYLLLPFKGLYLKTLKPDSIFKAHIYPVPDIQQPFLGIHTTLTSDGFLKLGPTALPAFSVENYHLFDGIEWNNLLPLVALQASLFATNTSNFRNLALKEIRYLSKLAILKEAQKLTSITLNPDQFDWYSPGIRAQLFDKSKRSLETDFVLTRHKNSFHVLNSISPAWTCSFFTAEHILSRILASI